MNQSGGLPVFGAVKPHLAASAVGFRGARRVPLPLPEEGRGKLSTFGAFPELTSVKGVPYNYGCDPVDDVR